MIFDHPFITAVNSKGSYYAQCTVDVPPPKSAFSSVGAPMGGRQVNEFIYHLWDKLGLKKNISGAAASVSIDRIPFFNILRANPAVSMYMNEDDRRIFSCVAFPDFTKWVGSTKFTEYMGAIEDPSALKMARFLTSEMEIAYKTRNGPTAIPNGVSHHFRTNFINFRWSKKPALSFGRWLEMTMSTNDTLLLESFGYRKASSPVNNTNKGIFTIEVFLPTNTTVEDSLKRCGNLESYLSQNSIDTASNSLYMPVLLNCALSPGYLPSLAACHLAKENLSIEPQGIRIRLPGELGGKDEEGPFIATPAAEAGTPIPGILLKLIAGSAAHSSTLHYGVAPYYYNRWDENQGYLFGSLNIFLEAIAWDTYFQPKAFGLDPNSFETMEFHPFNIREDVEVMLTHSRKVLSEFLKTGRKFNSSPNPHPSTFVGDCIAHITSDSLDFKVWILNFRKTRALSKGISEKVGSVAKDIKMGGCELSQEILLKILEKRIPSEYARKKFILGKNQRTLMEYIRNSVTEEELAGLTAGKGAETLVQLDAAKPAPLVEVVPDTRVLKEVAPQEMALQAPATLGTLMQTAIAS